MNAIYSGPFVTLAKAEFSNSQNANIQKWSAYVKGSANRQEVLERALEWVSKGDIGAYMSAHRNDKNINELKNYFNSVIDWVSAVFVDVLSEMRGLEWGRLYEEHHGKSYDPKKMADEVRNLVANDYVKNRKGIFEFLLGGSVDMKLLDIRVFETPVKRAVYAKQTQAAEAKGISNCPLCAIGDNANKSRIYKFEEMDADHVSAWSKGGDSSAKNCRCSALPTIAPKVIDNPGPRRPKPTNSEAGCVLSAMARNPSFGKHVARIQANDGGNSQFLPKCKKINGKDIRATAKDKVFSAKSKVFCPKTVCLWPRTDCTVAKIDCFWPKPR